MEEEIHEIIVSLSCCVNGFWKLNSTGPANESINYSEAVNYGRVVYICVCTDNDQYPET